MTGRSLAADSDFLRRAAIQAGSAGSAAALLGRSMRPLAVFVISDDLSLLRFAAISANMSPPPPKGGAAD